MARTGATWKIIDKNMLGERASEEWEKLNQGGRAFQKRVESLLQRNEQWLKMNAAGKEFEKGVEIFLKEQPVRRFFERLIHNGATAQAVQLATGTGSGKQKKARRKFKKDKYNLLGNEYVDLSEAYTRGKVLGQGGFGKVSPFLLHLGITGVAQPHPYRLLSLST